ncbi:MAG: hypothetical protein E2P02_13980 [Acidobacteria bacterium]|nr:MAG: hypothetical protein E2P02_13980 [Acidobacteriota bacterium]
MAGKQRSPISWKLRKGFWNGLSVFKFRGNKPAKIPVPGGSERRIEPVPLTSKFPAIPAPNILVADHVPADERSRPKYYFYEVQVALYKIFGAMQPGLPPIADDPEEALREAYTKRHRKYFRAPRLPQDWEGEDKPDLGRLAVASPYGCYLEKSPEGGFQWDLRELSNYQHHDGLHSLGVRVLFEVDEATKSLRAYRIDSELGAHSPSEPEWPLAKKLALCALSTHLSLVRHFNWVHLVVGSAVAIATRNAFKSDHPLCRLLWPHIYGTQYSNEIVTKGQMAKGGDFETTFSFTHQGMCKLFADTYITYPIAVIDPEADARRRGILDGGFEVPSHDNLVELFDVMHAHARRYVEAYYDTDEDIRTDEQIRAWLSELAQVIPNGIEPVFGREVTRSAVARLIGAFIYLETVQHDLLGTFLWDYQMWVWKQPVRVYQDGRNPPLDVYQRLVNANFNLNVKRRELMYDFSYLALDEKGVAAFGAFQKDLKALESRMESEEFADWRISPKILEANINA